MAKMTQTTWTVDEGLMTFFLPTRQQHSLRATSVDHPVSMARLVDTIASEGLNADELTALAEIVMKLATAHHAV